MYALPTPSDWVTASWQSHRDRNPPSSEPGTDYGCAYGADVYAVEAGVVTYTKTSNSGGMGRVVEYRLNDGRHTRSLHLSEVHVGVGQHVARGQRIARSGASGNGSDWYYGPHEHHTLWPGAAWAAPTIDFAPYVGGGTPPPEPEPEPAPPAEEEEEDMPKNSGIIYERGDGVSLCAILNLGSGAWHEWQDAGGAYNSAVAQAFDAPTFAAVTQGHRDNIYEACAAVREGRR